MGQGYLIDTNAVIEYLDNKLPAKASTLIDKNGSQISVITRMELLGWQQATQAQIKVLHQFINASAIFNLEESVILKTIDIRRKYRVKLADAIIASTALVYNLVLVTRNTEDFKKIKGLHLLNPWEK